MRFFRIWLALMCAATSGLSQTIGETNQARIVRAVTLKDCIESALEQNLGIQIARFDPQIAAFDLAIARAGYDPTFSISGLHSFSLSGGGIDPDTQLALPTSETDANNFRSGLTGVLPSGLSYTASGNITETYGNIGGNPSDNTRGSAGISLSQPLLRDFWIDGTRLAISVSRNNLKISELAYRGLVINLITEVEFAYYSLIAARENVTVQLLGLELADRLLAENKKRVEVGAMAPLDEKQAESQVAASRADLITAQRDYGTALNTLRSLISNDYLSLHNVVLDPAEKLVAVPQEFNVHESWGKGLRNRPDLAQGKLLVENAGLTLKFAKNQVYPALDLVGSYGHGASGSGIREFSDGFGMIREGSRPFYTYGAQLSIPLWNRAARERLKSSRADQEQTVLELKQAEQTVLVAIDEAINGARASLERVAATREARVYAEAALDAEQKKLQSGKSTSFVVLELQRDLTQARSDEIEALAEYNRALATVAQAEGTTLERRNVDVKVR